MIEINLIIFSCNYKGKDNQITTGTFDGLLKLQKLSQLTFDFT